MAVTSYDAADDAGPGGLWVKNLRKSTLGGCVYRMYTASICIAQHVDVNEAIEPHLGCRTQNRL